MQNTLGDLNNHLFAEMERLGDENLEGDKLQVEISRAKALADIASKIVDNASLVLEGEKFKAETLGRSKVEPSKLLEG